MNTFKDFIFAAIDTLSQGGTLLYPTDTIWGIGCDATVSAAVDKVYSIKRRDHGKSMLVLCSDIPMVERYIGRVGDREKKLLMSLDRPTTLIMPVSKDVLADNLRADDGTIGVRLPRMELCQTLLRELDRPIVSTSANFSGAPSPSCFDEIDCKLLERVDYCFPASFEKGRGAVSSRIVKINPDGSIAVIRQ